MSITVECPRCGQHHKLEPETAGTVRQCECGQPYRVPGPGGVPPSGVPGKAGVPGPAGESAAARPRPLTTPEPQLFVAGRNLVLIVVVGLFLVWLADGFRASDVAPIDSVDNSDPSAPAPEALWKPTITQVDMLIADLSSDEPYKARGAGIKLGKIADPPLERLLKVFRGQDDGAVIAVGFALAGIGRPAVPHLIAALERDDAVAVRTAANALGSIGKEDVTAVVGAADALMIAVRRHSLKVRDVPRTASSYGNSAQQSARNAMISRAGNEAEAVAGALRALGIMREKRALPMIIAALDNSNGVVGAAAVEALAEFGPTATSPLIAAWQRGEAHTGWGVKALGATKDPKAVDLLIAALPTKLGWQAAEALGETGDQRAAEPLLAALKRGAVPEPDPDLPPVTGGMMGGGSGGMMGGGSIRPVGPWAIDSLGKLKYAPAVPALVAALDDPDAAVQSAAVKALGKIGDKAAVMPLIGVTQRKRGPDSGREYSRLIKAAVSSLGMIGDERALEPLIALLTCGDTDIHTAAIGGLGTLGGTQVIEPLMSMIRTGNSTEKHRAQMALAGIGAPAAPTLVKGLASEETRTPCRSALQGMGVAAMDAMIAALEAPDCPARDELIRLLNQLARNHPRAKEAVDRAKAAIKREAEAAEASGG